MKVRVKGWFLYVCKYIQMVQIKLINVLYKSLRVCFTYNLRLLRLRESGRHHCRLRAAKCMSDGAIVRASAVNI